MISFELSEAQAIAQSVARAAAQERLRPLARSIDDQAEIGEATRQQLWDLGLVQVQVEDVRDNLLNAIVLEELAWADAAAALSVGASMAFVQAIVDQGTPVQKAILPRFSGRQPATAAIALTEPSFDFDVTELTTVAIPAGDGYRLDGVKSFVPLAGRCSHFLVIAQSPNGQQAFIVPAETAGVSVEPQQAMGLKGLSFGRLRFSGAVIGADARLGGGNGGDVQRIIDSARVAMAAVLLGIGKAAYDYVKDYTSERVAHGSVLARKQTVGFRIANMHIGLESLRWMTWRAALDLGKRSPQATRSARMAHLYATEQAAWITDESVQLLGGHGFLKDHPVELWYRNAKTLAVLEGLAGV